MLVDDNPGDIRLIVETFKDSENEIEFNVAVNGNQALEKLRREGNFANEKRPDLIILDLNLPQKDGREVLAEIKSDNKLKQIPVIVLTTSAADQDIKVTYDLHANCFLTKPVDLDRFMECLKSVEEFWVNVATLPPRDEDDK